MSFRLNSYQQLSLFDKLAFLSQRQLKMLQNSWAQKFSDIIFRNIDEMIFAPLYSPNANSRPNAPVNVIVGALILKEFTGMTDDEIVESCNFDYRFQYGLHTTSFDEQPLSDRTFSRFRERCAAYEVTTGIDLIHECMVSLSEKIAEYMNINTSVKRMDSMMIEANIRKMSRLELIYTCNMNLVKILNRSGADVKDFKNYLDSNNRNTIIYHDRDTAYEQRVDNTLKDSKKLLELCEPDFREVSEYELLKRVIEEQTNSDNSGNLSLKGKGEGITSDALQNPSDPDATYRVKAGKSHQGYSANITEAVDEKGSVITDYQYDTNNRSDSSFISEVINESSDSEIKTETIITDGAYNTGKIQEMTEGKSVEVISTDMVGRKPKDILADFEFTNNGKNVLKCAAGHKPKKSGYIRQSGQIRVSFEREKCENCPFRGKCKPKLNKRTATMFVSYKSHQRALQIRSFRDDELMQVMRRIRNGVESLPSLLRNRFLVDRMPVRGKIRTKQFFGFKVGAVNFIKLLRFENHLQNCTARADLSMMKA